VKTEPGNENGHTIENPHEKHNLQQEKHETSVTLSNGTDKRTEIEGSPRPDARGPKEKSPWVRGKTQHTKPSKRTLVAIKSE
jgi:hypothetical protein